MMTQHSLGWLGPDKVEVVVTNRSGASLAIGACQMLDRRRTDSANDSLSNVLGGAQVGIANCVNNGAATTDMMVTETFGIAQNTAPDNGKVRLRLRGFCDVVKFITADVILLTSRCYASASAATVTCSNAAQENTGTAAALARKVIFLPHTAATAPGSTDGWFDGISGFGTILLTA